MAKITNNLTSLGAIYEYKYASDYTSSPSFKILYLKKFPKTENEDEETKKKMEENKLKLCFFDFFAEIRNLRKGSKYIENMVDPVFSADIQKCAEQRCWVLENSVKMNINPGRCNYSKCKVEKGETIKKCLDKRCVRTDDIVKNIDKKICINKKCSNLRNAFDKFCIKSGRIIELENKFLTADNEEEDIYFTYKIRLSSSCVLELQEYKTRKIEGITQDKKTGIISFFADSKLNFLVNKFKLNPDEIAVFTMKQIEYDGDKILEKMFEDLKEVKGLKDLKSLNSQSC
jgi:hypothetical protein